MTDESPLRTSADPYATVANVRSGGFGFRCSNREFSGSTLRQRELRPTLPVGLRLEKLRAAFRVVQDRLEARIATQWQEGRASSDVDERDACGLAHQFRQTGQRFVLAAGHRAA